MTALVERLVSRDPGAIARAISIIERNSRDADTLLAEVQHHPRRAYRIGITGPPGAGKSSLVSRLIEEWRRRGRTVAALVIDPSSPISGGALLGDRVRLQHHAADPGVFIRSMAARGHSGGVSAAASGAVAVLDLAGFDVILIETLGVGQDQVDVARLVDVTVVTLLPGAGDQVQALKAGLMEIADVFAINKSDLPGATELADDVKASLALDESADLGAQMPDVLLVSAARGEGIAELVDALDRARRTAVREPLGQARGVGAPSRSGPTVAVDHVALASPAAGPLVALLRQVFNLTVSEPEILPEHQVTVSFAQTGGATVEIVSPTGPGSPLEAFLARRGTALHHVALRVHNLETELTRLKDMGIRLIDERPRAGANRSRVAFLHPASTCGVLIELVEHPIE
jgi:LAO/AO transport system kinase